MVNVLKGALLPIVFLLSWQSLAMISEGVSQLDTFSYPTAIATAAYRMMADRSLVSLTTETIVSMLGGFGIGVSVGLVSGVVLGLSDSLRHLTNVPLQLLRPMPSVALVPLALLVYGFGYRMEIAVVAFASVWPMLIFTQSAVRGVDVRLIEVGKSLELSLRQRVTKIVLPAAAPMLFVGVRLSAAVSLVVAVTVEIIANPLGLGHALVTSQESLQPDQMFAILFWVGILGWSLNKLLLGVQARFFLQQRSPL